MADSHAVEAHHGPNLAAYLTVFAALSVFTAVSFVVNHHYGPGNVKGASIILAVAVVKACLVGAIFMHLKYDWFKLYFLILPVFIMATMMIMVLLPDIVISWHTEAAHDTGLIKVESHH